ncbi:SIMPL domain-containing protein [Tenacibaculum finnmarkense]|uniref:SIMPL domain-containing protein n=1 Tax=Tenacibaculum finnmarkense TaxID=2781243 RepID=UPI001E6019BC|nr:SIMPL domain-containing protein [Tenacibaculum finnmarkense]MCD8423658.1 SIMPL domain-containing protein [Tenacibaculum finnmarkense genomovar ulcerans]MCG8239811.1 SIMPL domain-containing protein [Tenacibaculum finnmarkense genomovar ulcerans]
MKYITLLTFFSLVQSIYSQNKNFIDLPYIETSAKVDTLVVPDKIYLSITISEKDTKGKIPIEELEIKMAEKLKSIDIDISKQLFLNDLSSNFKKYFLKQQDVLKVKSYTLLVFDAKTAGKTIIELEQINISNVRLEKTEYSKIEKLKLELKSRAILKAKQKAEYMTKPLGQKVGKAIFISDYNNVSNVLAGRVAGVQIRGKSSLKRFQQEYESIDIEFQKLKVESGLNVKFAIE